MRMRTHALVQSTKVVSEEEMQGKVHPSSYHKNASHTVQKDLECAYPGLGEQKQAGTETRIGRNRNAIPIARQYRSVQPD